jgi:hypothetical protein
LHPQVISAQTDHGHLLAGAAEGAQGNGSSFRGVGLDWIEDWIEICLSFREGHEGPGLARVRSPDRGSYPRLDQLVLTACAHPAAPELAVSALLEAFSSTGR